jgi:tetratricopeptide (TPR) repeat protein
LKRILFLTAILSFIGAPPAFSASKEDLRKCQIGPQYEKNANKLCRKVIKDFASRPDKRKEVGIAWHALASDADFNVKNYEQAAEYYSNAIAVDGGKHFLRVFNYRGDVYRKLGRYNKAIADFEHLIKILPKDAIYGEPYDKREAWAYLGRVYHEIGKHKQAADNLAKGYYAVKNNLRFKEIFKFYGFDKEENVKAYQSGTYIPSQLAVSKPATGAGRGGSVRTSRTPPNDGLYRSADPVFSMGDPSLDF